MSNQRKPNRRFPRRVHLAVNPVERVVALYGGKARAVAGLLDVAERTVMNRRNDPGAWSLEHVTSLENALAREGWIIPEGFLTDPHRVFDAPERAAPDEALAALEMRRAAASEREQA